MPGSENYDSVRLVRFNEVRRLTGLSRGTIRRLEQLGAFPPHVRLTPHVIAWDERALVAWVKGRVAGGTGLAR